MGNKALFWDFDGTLIQPNRSSFCSLKEALLQLHYEIADEHIAAVLRSVLSWNNWEHSYEDATGDQWWDRLFDDLIPFYERNGITDYEKVNSLLKENVTSFRWYSLFEDTDRVLRYCMDKGWRNYIVSNNYPELPQAIEMLGLAPYFEGYAISSLVGYEKPHPGIFRYAMELAEHPEDAYMIGDNPMADIQGAHSAGMKTIFLHPADRAPCLDADFNCVSLTEIMSIIG